jgi:hypothetical protein
MSEAVLLRDGAGLAKKVEFTLIFKSVRSNDLASAMVQRETAASAISAIENRMFVQCDGFMVCGNQDMMCHMEHGAGRQPGNLEVPGHSRTWNVNAGLAVATSQTPILTKGACLG